MANFLDKILDVMGVEKTEEADEYEYEYEEPDYRMRDRGGRDNRDMRESRDSRDSREEIRTTRNRSTEIADFQSAEERRQQKKAPAAATKLVGMQGGQSRQNMVLYQPQSSEDSQIIIDYMKAHRAVILNLDNMEKSQAQRILDYVTGASYALNGKTHKISNMIFLLAPVDANVMDNITNSGTNSRSSRSERYEQRPERNDRYDRYADRYEQDIR